MAILDTPLYVEPKNLQFPPLGETKSIPVTFIWEFPTYPREIAAEKWNSRLTTEIINSIIIKPCPYSSNFFYCHLVCRKDVITGNTILSWVIFHQDFPESLIPTSIQGKRPCISDSGVTLISIAGSCFQWPTSYFCQYTLWFTILQTFNVLYYAGPVWKTVYI